MRRSTKKEKEEVKNVFFKAGLPKKNGFSGRPKKRNGTCVLLRAVFVLTKCGFLRAKTANKLVNGNSEIVGHKHHHIQIRLADAALVFADGGLGYVKRFRKLELCYALLLAQAFQHTVQKYHLLICDSAAMPRLLNFYVP